MGQVADAFTGDRSTGLPGHLAIGHTRYSTAGESTTRERAADPDRLRARPDRHRAQRQSRQRARAARRARARRVDLPDHQRHRGGPASLRPLEGADGRRGRRRVGLAGQRRVFACAVDEEPADRGARPARVPSARARPARRRLDRLLGDVRARPDRRDLRARHRTRRGADHQRRRPALDSSRFRRRRWRTASSSTSTSRAPTATSSAAA